jgi:hypothetical protein
MEKQNFGLNQKLAWLNILVVDERQLRQIRKLIEVHEHEIRSAWQEHFGC